MEYIKKINQTMNERHKHLEDFLKETDSIRKQIEKEMNSVLKESSKVKVWNEENTRYYCDKIKELRRQTEELNKILFIVNH